VTGVVLNRQGPWTLNVTLVMRPCKT
jgi:hypothetical protein